MNPRTETDLIMDPTYYFIWFDFQDVTFFSRLKLAFVLLLTPFTFPFLGRSIRVRCVRKTGGSTR